MMFAASVGGSWFARMGEWIYSILWRFFAFLSGVFQTIGNEILDIVGERVTVFFGIDTSVWQQYSSFVNYYVPITEILALLSAYIAMYFAIAALRVIRGLVPFW